MRGLEDDGRRITRLKGLFPALDAQAPLVAGLETGKIPLRNGSDEVIPPGLGKFQKVLGHAGADKVQADVIGAGSAAAVAIESCQRVKSARLQIATENIFGHGDFISRRVDRLRSIVFAPESIDPPEGGEIEKPTMARGRFSQS